MSARSIFLACLVCVIFQISGCHADGMRVRGENNSVMIKAIKYILDELAEDVHKKKGLVPPYLPVKNDTVTKWDTTYYTEHLHPADDIPEPEEYNANEMGLIVMSEYVVVDEEMGNNVSDFKTILKPLVTPPAQLELSPESAQPSDTIQPPDTIQSSDAIQPIAIISDDIDEVLIEEHFALPDFVTKD